MLKKNALAPSPLHLQTIKDKQAYLVARVERELDRYARSQKVPNAWQSNQLNYAIEFIAEGLYGLASCELDVFSERRTQTDMAIHRQSSADGDTDSKKPGISLSRLRHKLRALH